jgi:hypothetical protein
MNKQTYYKYLYYVLVLIIILFSFFHHSSLFSPFLNSDDAVVILMIHDFHLPHDFYYWEANRFGSLIPLMGQFFFKILHVNPVIAESLAHYSLLIAGFLGFASLFRSKINRLIFAVVWFLPPLRMIDILKVSQGEQYALIGISVFLINSLYKHSFTRYRLREHLLLISIALTFIVSIWVSDLTVITVFIIIIVHVLFYLKKNSTKAASILFKTPEILYIFISAIACGLFIYYLKKNASGQVNYYNFHLKIFFDSLKIFIVSIRDLLIFKSKEPFTSIYIYLIIIATCIFLPGLKKSVFKSDRSKWIIIFLIDIVLVFTVILSSKWAYVNGVPRRYFVCNYVSYWVAFLLILENTSEIPFRKLLYTIIIATVLLGGLGTIYNFKYISPGHLTPTIKISREFQKLGKTGIIAEYWNSYINAVTDPSNIKATPNEKSMVRNQNMVDSVFAQSNLYVIRDMWMDSFPDTLEQFGYVLQKHGTEFRLGDCNVCNYRKLKIHKEFPVGKFKTTAFSVHVNDTGGEIMIPESCDTCKKRHVVYGPYISLGIGDFTSVFFLKANPLAGNVPIALLDVTADNGLTPLAEKTITGEDFLSEDYQAINIDFTTKKRYSNIEFRIYYYGNSDLYFDHLVLSEKCVPAGLVPVDHNFQK